jgi:hypothetical protein
MRTTQDIKRDKEKPMTTLNTAKDGFEKKGKRKVDET